MSAWILYLFIFFKNLFSKTRMPLYAYSEQKQRLFHNDRRTQRARCGDFQRLPPQSSQMITVFFTNTSAVVTFDNEGL